jgi:hypothetical protein
MKKIVSILVVLLVVAVLAVVGVAFFLGSIVKKGVETVGSKVAQVPVRLDSANISVLSGNGSLKGLFVANPEGFKSPSAIEAGEINVSIVPGSALSDVFVVRSVQVISPVITLEGLKGDNLQKILGNLQASTGGRPKDKKPEAGEAKSGGAGKKIQIDDLLIKGGKVNLFIPMGGTASVALPEFHMTGLGKDSGGLTAAEISARVINEILNRGMSAAAGGGMDATKFLQGTGQGTNQQVEKALKGVGNLLGK